MVRRGLVGFSEVWYGAVMFSEVRYGEVEKNTMKVVGEVRLLAIVL